MVSMVCEQCGGGFRVRPYAASRARFCSASCRAKGVARDRSRPLDVRFWEKVDKRSPEECWPWTGATTFGGYGVIGLGRDHLIRAHRLSFEMHEGPIPKGLIIRHRCDNPGCVNPAHLIPGTQKQNMDDAVRRGRTRGHPRKLTDEDVANIRLRVRSGEKKIRLAAEYSVARSYITLLTNQNPRRPARSD